MDFVLFLFITGLGVWIIRRQQVADPKYRYLNRKSRERSNSASVSGSAFDIKNMQKSQFFVKQIFVKQKRSLVFAFSVIGRFSYLKIVLFLTIVILGSFYVSSTFFTFDAVMTTAISTGLFSIVAVRWLVAKREKNFNKAFPDALNIMMSAVTAGESLNHAFAYVGTTLDTDIGLEFMNMSDRMNLGESPELIFKRSANNFPYPAYLFFLVAIQANITKGGQLKEVFRRLIRILTEARNLEKKKMAMTSEARISAKIVASIPFVFMFAMQFFAPENLHYVLFEPGGKWILYYVFGSIFFGMLIITWLVKRVK